MADVMLDFDANDYGNGLLPNDCVKAKIRNVKAPEWSNANGSGKMYVFEMEVIEDGTAIKAGKKFEIKCTTATSKSTEQATKMITKGRDLVSDIIISSGTDDKQNASSTIGKIVQVTISSYQTYQNWAVAKLPDNAPMSAGQEECPL